MNSVFLTVSKFISDHQLLSRGDQVLIGCSGGPDSIALLHILSHLRKKYHLELSSCYINHQLRHKKIIAKEQKIVSDYSKKLGISFYHKTISVKPKASVENSARILRYHAFNQFMKRLGATKIAVGHHADDQAETILMRLFSGSGFKGLRGMAPENDRCVIRPLLNVTKKEILEFCKKENLAFILDETNSNENFLRNKLRHKILPVLRREINPSIDQTLLGIGQLFYMTDDYLKSQLADMEADVVSRLNRRISIDVKKFTTYPDILQYYLVNDILVSLSPDLQAVKFNHVDSVIQIVQKNVGGVKLNLGNGVTCVKNKNKIEFAK